MTAADRPSLAKDDREALREALAAALETLRSPQFSATERIVLDPALLAADDAAAAVLERLSRKVEVSRRLLAAYADGFGKPVGSQPQSPPTMSGQLRNHGRLFAASSVSGRLS